VEGPFCCTISLYVFSELKSDSYSYRIHSPSTSKLQHYGPTPLGDSRYLWKEGLPPGCPWLMLILILPQNHTLVDPSPLPVDTKAFAGRLALYWVLKGDATEHTRVEITIKKLERNLESELICINKRFLSPEAPTTSTITVEDLAAQLQRQARDLILISYSHADEELCKEFLKMVRPTAQKNGLNIWSDHEIPVGAKWRAEIERALERARIAVLLVSPDFLNSSFIENNELPQLLKAASTQGTKIFWIACSPSNVVDTEIWNFQGANQPSKPLSTLSKAARQKEMQRISQQLFRLSQAISEG